MTRPPVGNLAGPRKSRRGVHQLVAHVPQRTSTTARDENPEADESSGTTSRRRWS